MMSALTQVYPKIGPDPRHFLTWTRINRCWSKNLTQGDTMLGHPVCLQSSGSHWVTRFKAKRRHILYTITNTAIDKQQESKLTIPENYSIVSPSNNLMRVLCPVSTVIHPIWVNSDPSHTQSIKSISSTLHVQATAPAKGVLSMSWEKDLAFSAYRTTGLDV